MTTDYNPSLTKTFAHNHGKSEVLAIKEVESGKHAILELMGDSPWKLKAHRDDVNGDKDAVFDHHAYTMSKNGSDSKNIITLGDVLATD